MEEKTMRDVVIAGYLRTAQSRSRPNDPARDWFCKMRADELLAKLLPEVIKKSGIEPIRILHKPPGPYISWIFN